MKLRKLLALLLALSMLMLCFVSCETDDDDLIVEDISFRVEIGKNKITIKNAESTEFISNEFDDVLDEIFDDLVFKRK